MIFECSLKLICLIRLDRLVLLLDTGTSVVRNTAADQLAQVQKAHPDELYNLLGRIAPYLKSNQWETRVAAAKAIGGIVENVPQFDPVSAKPQNSISLDEHPDSSEAPEGSLVKSEDAIMQDQLMGDEARSDHRADLQVQKDAAPDKADRNKSFSLTLSEEKDDRLEFESFDIYNVIRNGKVLLGSAGKEYDWDSAGLSAEERLARAKHSVTARLGLGAEYMEKDFLSAQDLSTPSGSRFPASVTSSGLDTAIPVDPHSQTMFVAEKSMSTPSTPVGDDGLSARQRNILKRKHKMGSKPMPNKVRIVNVTGNSASRRSSQDDGSRATPARVPEDSQAGDYFSVTPQAQNDSKVVVEHKSRPQSPSSLLKASADSELWPFDGLVEILSVDLFDPRWETRHGAALALREVLKWQAPGAGRRPGYTPIQNAQLNKRYLDDLACRLCCVFALDRFGDYVSDQVVAPIRETISQTLAALLKHLPQDSVKSTFTILSSLVFQENLPVKAWEVTHGGMLGLKYLVAIRKDILTSSPELLDSIVAAVLHGLADDDDDVRAVGAATLIPIATEFVQSRPQSLSHLLDVLWDCLADLRDDLSASTGSVMDLLAKLCSNPTVLQVMQAKSLREPDHSFAMLVPRLYPFLRHTITSVRRAVVRALQTFLTADRDTTLRWVDARLLRLIFQNLLVEQNLDVLNATISFWSECLKLISFENGAYLHKLFDECLTPCVMLVMTPIGQGRNCIPLDTSLFIRPSGVSYSATPVQRPEGTIKVETSKFSRKRKIEKKEEMPSIHNIDSPVLHGDVELVGLDVILRTRVAAAAGLGQLLGCWPEDAASDAILSIVGSHTRSVFSSPRYLVGILVQEYATSCQHNETFERLRPIFEGLLIDSPPNIYTNLTPLLHVVRAQCQALCSAFIENGRVSSSKVPSLAIVCEGDPKAGPSAFDASVAEKLIGEDFDRLRRLMSSSFKGPVAKVIEDAHYSVTVAIEILKDAKHAEDIRIAASNGAAFVSLGRLAKKLNPNIKSLMESIKKEENLFMQRRSANALASLVYLCSASGRGSAADKLIKNLCAFLCVDTSETPEFHRNRALIDEIYSLRKDTISSDIQDKNYIRETREARIKRSGAQMALEEMAIRFESKLFEKIPKLEECIFGPLKQVFSERTSPAPLSEETSTLGQELIDGLSVLRALVSRFDQSLFKDVLNAMPLIILALQSEYSTVRYAAAGCFAHICKTKTVETMQVTITTVLPMLADASILRKRQGAIEAINFLVTCLDVDILPYVIFLIVPVLGRMSDSDNDVRIVATTTFAMLVKLVPLEAGIPDPPGFSKELLEGRDSERRFIQQMLNGSKVETFEIPVAIKADLRSYQQDGVNWLAFLNKYQLHGILCDDMGLGKTLQTICIVASDHHNRSARYKETSLDEFRPLPSLIICPPSLSGHWQHEIQSYAPFLTCMTYVGYPPERKLQRSKLSTVDVVITSYDIARNDNEFLSKKQFNYCVLDEGHIIKNAKAKLTQAVKQIKANHRLILSGTPIQNNVLELWSLFDFLMPGFLGTEKSFHDRYAKPIANSRDSKSSSKEQEAGAIALEALHKQVLPFLLRRLKEEVLADLPPKIIQDYYCELSPLQKSLYNEFADSQASMVAQETAGEMKKESKSHVFQALQYMRKLCNHPALVMNEKHPKYEATVKTLAQRNESLRDVHHAPKLLALRDLLVDCGIGSSPSETGAGGTAAALGASVVNQHRALIFCQIKDMLDMVENDVLKKLLPSVSYMRLDGTTDPRNRQSIVQEFNADPSIDVLLLTTHVGGLGLNLTGADTVIFVEHDWNPMKDLQAMDRAHRIGQKKTVNVYRLITRGTLEEKIMGLQKFKINIASTIVNQQNSGLATMETDQILDLFDVNSSETKKASKEEGGGLDDQGNIVRKGQKSVFDDLEELHNENEYAEFDVDSFVQKL